MISQKETDSARGHNKKPNFSQLKGEPKAGADLTEKEDLQGKAKPKMKLSNTVSAVVFACMILFNISNMWFYDFPQIFTDRLITRFGVTTVDVSLLYSVYSIPSILIR